MWAAWTAFINVGFASADGNAEFLTMVEAVRIKRLFSRRIGSERTETGVTVRRLYANLDDNDVSDVWCQYDGTMPVDERMRWMKYTVQKSKKIKLNCHKIKKYRKNENTVKN